MRRFRGVLLRTISVRILLPLPLLLLLSQTIIVETEKKNEEDENKQSGKSSRHIQSVYRNHRRHSLTSCVFCEWFQ